MYILLQFFIQAVTRKLSGPEGNRKSKLHHNMLKAMNMRIKRFTGLGLFLLMGLTLFGQNIVPAGFNYQAIARDTLGSSKANQAINVKFTITDQFETSTPWVETHSITTDQFGLFSAVIGQGTKVGGTATTFSIIDWKSYNYYVKTEIQEGMNWFLIGKEPLLSVPYAMVAKEAIYSSPIGTVVAFAGTTPPSGWLLCDGSEINRTTYIDLFNVIGVAYGYGNNATTYNLPDLRGRFVRGVDGAAGNDPDKATRIVSNTGGNAGNMVGSLQDDAFQGHIHQIITRTTPTSFGTGNIGFTNGGISYSDPYSISVPISDGTNGTPQTTSETRSKNVYMNYIIKY